VLLEFVAYPYGIHNDTLAAQKDFEQVGKIAALQDQTAKAQAQSKGFEADISKAK
jgi:hypothetical protein